MVTLLLLSACSGTPADDTAPVDTDADADTDTDADTDADTDTDTDVPNQPPSAPAIAITPAVPAAGIDFTVSILTESVDPDGDTVTYRYAWTLDGVDAGITEPTVPGAGTVDLQVWSVAVTPNDGEVDGTVATASVTVGNAPPSAPGLAFTPTAPVEDDDLTVIIDPVPVDPEGDPLTTTITWYDDGAEVPWLADLTTVPGTYVDNNDVLTVVVAVTDGLHEPVTATASVTVEWTCDNPPSGPIDVTTITTATAYHGIEFTDDGALIGYDSRASLVKSWYDGTSEVWVPGFGTVQQIDRMPDGDYVVADGSYGTLVRVTPEGGTSTMATNLGSIYAVTVGPDEMIYIANGAVLRVDPDTGASETLVPSTAAYAHSLAFNLDSTRLYIGNIGADDIYYQELDSNLDPVGGLQTYATIPGTGYHDGLEVDECGSLYVADYSTRSFYRVLSDGTVSTFVPSHATEYGHGATWGNGVGGWGSDTIYQPEPYNNNAVREVIVGFESGDTVRTWNGVAVPW